jgi:predicted RNA-binding Zn ribbon-like protein
MGRGDFSFIGGAPALDFANTVSWRGRAEPSERLASYGDLVDWACRAGVVPPATGRRLRRTARERPADAGAALRRARALREAIYRSFSRQAAGKTPMRSDLERIQRAYVGAVRRARVATRGSTEPWRFVDDGDADLDVVARAIARSAVELATSRELARVRECLGEGCGWLFVDESRNRTRRWCSSADCGNRARVRRFHERRRRAKR